MSFPPLLRFIYVSILASGEKSKSFRPFEVSKYEQSMTANLYKMIKQGDKPQNTGGKSRRGHRGKARKMHDGIKTLSDAINHAKDRKLKIMRFWLLEL